MIKFVVFCLYICGAVLVSATKDDKWWYGKDKEFCIHNEHRCTDTSSQVCEHGIWKTTQCTEGTKCLGCNNWSCVAESDYDSLKDKWCVDDYKDCEKSDIHIYPSNSTIQQCIHGEFRCNEYNNTSFTERCDHGTWFSFPCAVGTKCLGCSDFECIETANGQYDLYKAQLCVEEKKDCEKTNLHIYPVIEPPCDHGSFRCTNNSTDRCDWGVWYAFPCAIGTKCLDCANDYECVLEDQYDSLKSQLCPKNETKDEIHYQKEGSVANNSIMTYYVDIYLFASIFIVYSLFV